MATYPVMLEDMPAPELRVYPQYTVIAEKFEAIVSLGMANSRMKDYFDLWVLLRNADLDQAILEQAVDATLKRRMTEMPVGWSMGSHFTQRRTESQARPMKPACSTGSSTVKGTSTKGC